MDYIFLFKWLLAVSPIAVVLVLMIGFNWGGGRAGAAGWFTAFLVAAAFFGAGPRLLAFAQTKGVLLSIYVLYIVWMALLLYNVVQDTGAIETIGRGIQRLTANRIIQLLILGWVFSSFLQGVAGFGVPIAVVGPLLMGLGFPPAVAVAAPAIGHSWSVSFGDMASSFQAMMAVTGLDGLFLAPWSAFFLGIAAYLCGLALIHFYGGFKAVKQGMPAVLIIGTIMAVTQYALAVNGLWTLAGFVAGMAGLLASVLVARMKCYANGQANSPGQDGDGAGMTFWSAFSAYIFLIIIVTGAELAPWLHGFLNSIKLSLSFPEVSTTTGYVTAAGYGKRISVFGHAGALLAYSALVSFLYYRSKGYYSSGALKRIWRKTVKSGVSTSIGIISMVCFALIMGESGMVRHLAEGISRVLGSAYPLFASAVGTLGAFMTGSNTNSNVVFSMLQLETAQMAGLSTAVILAAQTTGGSIGSMLAPAKILVGCSTVGLSGKEGRVLGATMRYGLVMTLLIGVLALVFTLA
jgi:lactate permease